MRQVSRAIPKFVTSFVVDRRLRLGRATWVGDSPTKGSVPGMMRAGVRRWSTSTMKRAPASCRFFLPLAVVLVGAVLCIVALLLVRGMTYRNTVEWSADLPGPVQGAFNVVSEYGIWVLIALFVLAAWQARRRGPQRLARGIAAGVGVVLAYSASEAVKVLVTELRPCHNFAESTIAACPGASDWSWPSNHATIAVAIAVAVLAMSPRLGLLSVPVAVLIGISRVVVGVHYFHDVVAGALLGATMVIICARWGTPLVAKGIAVARRNPTLDRLIVERPPRSRAADGRPWLRSITS